MEPHVFCGPEFILEVPADSVSRVLESPPQDATTAASASPPATTPTWVGKDGLESDPAAADVPNDTSVGPQPRTVRPDVLLRIQTELFNICTAAVRRHIHAHVALAACMTTDLHQAMEMVSRRMSSFSRMALPANSSSSYTGGAVPPAPTQVVLLQVKPTTSLNAEETASLQQSVRIAGAGTASTALTYLLLYVTDSRAAAQLHMLCLRNTCIALPYSCRLLNFYVSGGRAAAIVPSNVLQRRELLKSHHNFDAELWGVMEAKLTESFVQSVRDAAAEQRGGRLLSALEQREENVRAVLRYCEQHVRYAGVFDDNEEASPFLLAMGLCWRLGLTMDDVCRHFVRHPRRVIRALALFLARFTLAPEDYVYVFLPSICDEVIIASTEDAQVTQSMRELSLQLLTKNDVVDAWLPIVAKHWQETVIAPSIAFMEACWHLHGQSGDRNGAASENEAFGGDASAPHPACSSSKLFKEGGEDDRGDAMDVHGGGRGIAATFGFRSIAEIAEHAAQHARVLVPQSMATLLKRRRGEEDVFGGTRDGGGDDALDGFSDEEDDFLIHVDVRGDDDEDEGEPGMPGENYRRTRDFSRMGSTLLPAKRARTTDDGTGSIISKEGGGGGATSVRRDVVRDPHGQVMREGLKLLLSLLGRRALFRKDDKHYIEF